jgi:uncharacterized SAM-binding protein YcdF (DUF218 family)
MFFTLSKVLGFFAIPSNLVVAFGIAGLVLLATRWARAGRWLVGASFVALAVLGLSPIGNALIIPLEQRFPPWDESRGPPDGILVLGGAISPDVSLARDEVALNESAERLTVAAELARRYPNARVLFSGGTGALLHDEGSEAPFARRESRDCSRPHPPGGSVPQHHRECALLQADRAAEAGGAMAACHLGIPFAASHGCLSQGRICR